MTHLSARLRNAVLRLADAPQRTLSNLASRVGPSSGVRAQVSVPPPEHLTRLESVFEALSELPEQPHVAAAFELACDALQAELPAQAHGRRTMRKVFCWLSYVSRHPLRAL